MRVATMEQHSPLLQALELPQLVWAIQLQDGTVYFAQPRRLTRQPPSTAFMNGARHTILPSLCKAGEPLKG